MTSEVKDDLKIKLSGLNYLLSNGPLASLCHHSQMFRSPIPPPPPQTVPIWAIDQRERKALPADNKGQIKDKWIFSM